MFGKHIFESKLFFRTTRKNLHSKHQRNRGNHSETRCALESKKQLHPTPLEEIGRVNWDAATTAFSRDVRAVGEIEIADLRR